MPARKKTAEVKEEVKVKETKAEKPVKTRTKKVADDVKKAPAKAKAAAKKAAADVKVEVEKVEKKVKAPAAKKPAAKKAALKNEVIIQSPLGGVITPAEILAKTGPVDSVYVRVDENKAYWVKGEETGSVDLW